MDGPCHRIGDHWPWPPPLSLGHYYATKLPALLFSIKSECLAKEDGIGSTWGVWRLFPPSSRTTWTEHCNRATLNSSAMTQQCLLPPLTREQW
jgi:hypothetical protein